MLLNQGLPYRTQVLWLCRYFCSKGPYPTTNEFEAEQWFQNLSQEMELKKKRVENEVQLLKEKHYCANLQVTLQDLKYLMTECPTINAKEKYLNHMQNKMKLEETLAAKVKRKPVRHEQEVKERLWREDDEMILNPNTFGVTRNTRDHLEQYKRFITHRSAMSVINSPMPIVFDLDFDMSDLNEWRVCKQIEQCVSLNRFFPEPCAIHITSYLKNSFFANEQEMNISDRNTNFMIYHKEGFEDVFPRERLVYLSPDAPVLREHIPGDIYVIGGMTEQRGLVPDPVSLKKAKDLDIRHGSLPFYKYRIKPSQLKGSLSGYVLTIDSVFEFLLNINLKHHWEYVLKDTVNDRKVKQPSAIKKRKAFL